MEVFSLSSLAMVHFMGFIAIVVLPWIGHFVDRRHNTSVHESPSLFFTTTVLMWIITPIAGILFAADTPGYTPLEVGQYVMAFFVLYVTGGVMGLVSLMVHYSVSWRGLLPDSHEPIRRR